MYPERFVATRQMHLGKQHMNVFANQVLPVITATVLVNTIHCHVFKLTVCRKFKSKIYRKIPKISLPVYTPPPLPPPLRKKKNGKARILPMSESSRMILRSLSNNKGDGNENGKKAKGFY